MTSLLWPMALPAEGLTLLGELRDALREGPVATRRAALRLMTWFTQPMVEPSASRGCLAPWQQIRVERYLTENLELGLHTEDLARQVALSVSHFRRTFKASFGTTPRLHIRRLQLELAKRLMLTTEDGLSQIALTCGLTDQARLSKVFRRCTGETPGAWRRKHARQDPAAPGS